MSYLENMNTNENKPFLKGIVSGALFTGVIFFFYLGGAMISENSEKTELSSRSPARSQNDIVHKKAIELINNNLQTDQKLIELRSMGVEVKNEQHLREIQRRIVEAHNANSRGLGVEVTVEDGSSAVLRDLEDDSNIYDEQMTPEQKIELSLIRRREIASYEHQQRLQYVRQFLENARKNGYDIVLNDKLEVVQVRRIRGDDPYRGEESMSDLFQ